MKRGEILGSHHFNFRPEAESSKTTSAGREGGSAVVDRGRPTTDPHPAFHSTPLRHAGPGQRANPGQRACLQSALVRVKKRKLKNLSKTPGPCFPYECKRLLFFYKLLFLGEQKTKRLETRACGSPSLRPPGSFPWSRAKAPPCSSSCSVAGFVSWSLQSVDATRWVVMAEAAVGALEAAAAERWGHWRQLRRRS